MDALDTVAASIVETLWQPLVVLEGDLRVRCANRSFYQTFDARPEECEGKLLYEMGAREWDIPQLRESLEEVLRGRRELRGYTVERSFASIGPRSMVLQARLLRERNGHTPLIAMSIEDITERKHSEDTRQLLLAATSHDGLNVLNNIAGYAQLLDDADPPEQIVPRILALSMALGDIMRDMLDHADATNEQPNLAVVCARKLIRERAESIEWQCRQKGLGLFVDLPDECPITTDPGKVTRILDNVLSNAVRYTPTGKVHLQGRLIRTKLRLRVSDTGIGIPADDLERVFEPRYRSPTAREIAPLGTGLGLFTVKRFSEMLGGSARIKSSPQVGTTCTITLPRHAQLV